MALIGYTFGGSPIFLTIRGEAPNPHKKNKRYLCKGCKARTTKNQLKKNGNVCHQCKRPFKPE